MTADSAGASPTHVSEIGMPLIIAAAGRSRRYGRPKLLEHMPGTSVTLIEHVVAECLRGGAGPVLVVVGPESDPVYARIAEAVRLLGAYPLSVDPAPEEMRVSVEQGVAHIETQVKKKFMAEPRYVGFTPADLPGLDCAFVAALVDRCRYRTETLVRGTTTEGRGIHPVALAWKDRGLLAKLPPDVGLNALWNHPEATRHDWVYGDGSQRYDLDKPQDWKIFPHPPGEIAD